MFPTAGALTRRRAVFRCSMTHHFSRASRPAAPPESAWQPVARPPAPYEFALLSFPDGAIFRGAWNGKFWWGYDPRARRSCALQPVAWLPWE